MAKSYVKLGELASYINGYAFKPKDRGTDGLPIIRIQDLTGSSNDRGFYKGNYPSKIEINTGDVLISWSASLGVYIWNNGKALLNQHIFKVVFDKKEIDKDYFVYAVQFSLNKMKRLTHGATMKHVVKKDFENVLIPYPSLEEQRKIAYVLDKLKISIGKKTSELNKLDELIKARFVEMFGDAGQLNLNFKVSKLGEVADVKSSHRVFTKDFVNTGIPFYRGKEISLLAKGSPISETYFISKELYEKLLDEKTRPKLNDLLMPSICDKGQIWRVNTRAPFYYKDGRVLCISPKKEIFNSIYLQQYMKFKTKIEYRKLGTGSTFAEFKIFQLKNMQIIIPPLSLQNEFANFVQQVDKSKFENIVYLNKTLSSKILSQLGDAIRD